MYDCEGWILHHERGVRANWGDDVCYVYQARGYEVTGVAVEGLEIEWGTKMILR